MPPTDDDLAYFQPGFQPESLTIPRLRSILVKHNVTYPANAKKANLVKLFRERVAPLATAALAELEDVKPSREGITDWDESLELESVQSDMQLASDMANLRVDVGASSVEQHRARGLGSVSIIGEAEGAIPSRLSSPEILNTTDIESDMMLEEMMGIVKAVAGLKHHRLGSNVGEGDEFLLKLIAAAVATSEVVVEYVERRATLSLEGEDKGAKASQK